MDTELITLIVVSIVLIIGIVIPLVLLIYCICCCCVDRPLHKITPRTQDEFVREAEKLIASISEHEKLHGRIDYSLPLEGFLDKSYLSMALSHFTYWTNPDFLAFLFNRMQWSHTQPEAATTRVKAAEAAEAAEEEMKTEEEPMPNKVETTKPVKEPEPKSKPAEEPKPEELKPAPEPVPEAYMKEKL